MNFRSTPSAAHGTSMKQRLKEAVPSVAANRFTTGHLSKVTSSLVPETLFKAGVGALDSGTQPPCATLTSLALVCDFFLVLVWRVFLGEGEVRHTEYLSKKLKCFIPFALLQQKSFFFFNLDVPWYTWPKFFSAVPTFCERLEVTPKRVKF